MTRYDICFGLKSNFTIVFATVVAMAIGLSLTSPASAVVLTETFDLNSTDLPTDYPQYSYTDPTQQAVEGSVLKIDDGSVVGTHARLLADVFGGPMTVTVDLAGDSPGCCDNTIGLSIGSQTSDAALLFVYHAGFDGSPFGLGSGDFTVYNQLGSRVIAGGGFLDMGFVPTKGPTLHQTMTIAYDGAGTYDVTVSQAGETDFTLQLINNSLDGNDLKVGPMVRHLQGVGTGYFDNLVITSPDFPIPLGDFDRDGSVTTADHDIMRANWFATGNGLNVNGEVTDDGFVDLRDFKLFKETLFVPLGGLSGSSVPEPNTTVLLGLGFLGYVRQRKRRI